MTVCIRRFMIRDYDEVRALWEISPGVRLSEADTRERIEKLLNRSQGCSFVALDVGESTLKIVGAVLCGHDGRQGFIYHMAVSPDARRQRIGERLFNKVKSSLREQGIMFITLVARVDNGDGRRFWESVGGRERPEVITINISTALPVTGMVNITPTQ